MSHDDEEQIIRNALQELRNLDLKTDSPVVGRDFRKVILRQMELTHALFDRQHQNVLKQMELNRTFFERQHQDVDQLQVKAFQCVFKKSREVDYRIDRIDRCTCSYDVSINPSLDLWLRPNQDLRCTGIQSSLTLPS